MVSANFLSGGPPTVTHEFQLCGAKGWGVGGDGIVSCLPIIWSLENREVSNFAALPPPFTEAWRGLIIWLLFVLDDV